MHAIAEHEFTVRCTPEQAFDYLCDLRNELEWNAQDCHSMEKISDGPMGEGTRFLAKWKGAPPIEVEITRFDRPRRWHARSEGKMESNFTGEVEPHPDGALVRTKLVLTPHGFFKLVFPIFKVIFDRSENDVPGRIKRALDGRFEDTDRVA